MDPTIFFGALTVLYLMAYFFDCFFKSCMQFPYDAFLKRTGLTVQFMRLRWHTTAFNRTVLRWGTSGGGKSRACLMRSFTIGVLVALSLLPIGIILLFITIFSGDSGSGSSSSTSDASRLENSVRGSGSDQSVRVEILLPGVNLPLDEVGFYVSTLLCSTIVHELGHAIAAVLEDIPVTGFGFQLYFCIPLAYTEISSEHLNALRWFRKLRILCGGIWHNFLFAGICYLLFSTLGFMTKPLYTLNKGIIITDFAPNSPLRSGDERGLLVGNVITHINDCRVYNEDAWYSCLLRALRTKPGYCVSSDFIRLNDESIEMSSHHGTDGVLQCCDEKNVKLNCFEYIDDLSNDAPVEIPQHVCLNVRRTLEDAYGYCTSNCDRGFCLRPLLRNTTSILNFKRTSTHLLHNAATASATAADTAGVAAAAVVASAVGGSAGATETQQQKKWRDVIYVGHPADVTRTVRISPFVPKRTYIAPYWGDAYALFLKYNVVFSLGLALINALPCFGFDGHHIINTIINSFLVNRVTERPKRDVIALIVTCIGTLLFACAVLKVLWLSIFRKLF